jgi:glutamate-1-semialdehyde 2,1-aminomutase
VYQAGPLSGNPLAVAAGLATLAELDDAAYARLGQITARLADGMRDVAAQENVAVRVQSVPGLLTVFFSAAPVQRYSQAAACQLEAYGAWCRALLDRGVYPPASQFEAWFVSLAHSDEDVSSTLDAAAAAFAEVS